MGDGGICFFYPFLILKKKTCIRQCRVILHACPMNMRGYFFRRGKKNILKKIAKHVRWTCLVIKITFFFYGWKKNVHACSSYMCGIFFQDFFFEKSKKKNHACLKTLKTYMEFFDQICKIGESPHKSYEHTWFFSNSQIGLKSSIRAFSVVMRMRF